MATSKNVRVFHLATTQMVPTETRDFLEHLGAPDWETDAGDDHSMLAEIAGRGCYRSFGPGVNKNVTRVRTGNANYIKNGILAQKHGSVLEHAYDTFAICDVSRIVTHELVRHRQGTAFSQESGRYVRVDDMGYYFPAAFQADYLSRVYDEIAPASVDLPDKESWIQEAQGRFVRAMERAGDEVKGLEEYLGLDVLPDFGMKKKLQSSVRRVAPNGMTNFIIVTANHRAWRHIVSMRTNSSAEEEIRLAQYLVFEKLNYLHPAIYQDAELVYEPDLLPPHVPSVVFEHEKV